MPQKMDIEQLSAARQRVLNDPYILMKRHAMSACRLIFLLTLTLFPTAASSLARMPFVETRRPASAHHPPKYIFLFIGDGMGPAQVELASMLLPAGEQLHMRSFPATGMVETRSVNRLITDSGAAGSALATGHKTANGMISVAANGADTLKTIAEMARDKGWRTGIVSSVGIDNATPACFYAHNKDRDDYYAIALQMARSGFDYFAGGYAEGDFKAKRPPSAAFRGSVREVMEQAGYRITKNLNELKSIMPGTRCWAYGTYDAKAAMPYDMDKAAGDADLAAYTREGIRLLDNRTGFFMMVEGGKIDWACHANDAAAAARDVQAFDAAILEALEFYRQRPSETLIVVTADHECGGLSLGNLMNGYMVRPGLLKYQKISSQRFAEKLATWRRSGNVSHAMALDSVRVWYGLGADAPDSLLKITKADSTALAAMYADGKPDEYAVAVTRILNDRAGIGWASNVHTMTPVQVFAIGAGCGTFVGMNDNTAIARNIMSLGRFRKHAPDKSVKSGTRSATIQAHGATEP